MKSSCTHKRPFIIRLAFISLLLTGFIPSTPVYSDTISIQNTGNSHYENTASGSPQIQINPERKKTLIDESRDLSAFFILGIIINIIMAVTFAWWFSREWRRTKK